MKKQLFIGLTVLFSFLFSSGQGKTVLVQGKILEESTGMPLPFATVGITGSSHGTISNLDGEFAFYVPSTYSKDTISISYVGFETFKKAISQIKEPLAVSLKEKITILDEIEINAEQLTANQRMERALEKLTDNYSSNPFIIKGFFRDIRDQNGETVYLAEAAVDIQDYGYSKTKDRSKNFFLRGIRSSQSRVHSLLSGSLLNAGNSLNVNLEHNFWLNRLKYISEREEFNIESIQSKNDKLFYIIRIDQVVSMDGLAIKYKDMKFNLAHRYFVDTETFAIHKVEHIEKPIEGRYIGIERPYQGDTLFYSKKGWNQVIEFEEYNEKMYLKYHDVNYAFDIVDEKNKEIFLDMSYQFTFVVTDIETHKSAKPMGNKMNRNKPLMLQANNYDADFWADPSNAKLVPLTQKQINGLEKYQPLEEQFIAKKTKLGKNAH